MKLNLEHKIKKLANIDPLRVYGRIRKIVGLTIESEGPPSSVGEVLKLANNNMDLSLQVIGFNGSRVISMPFGDLKGISQGQLLYSTGKFPRVQMDESYLGRIINGLGQSLDDKGPLQGKHEINIYEDPVNAMIRQPISEILTTGVKVIDGLTTLGKGQKIGIFSGNDGSKSSLLGMMARYNNANVNVIALVGERSRELDDFINNSLGPEALKRSVVVAAASDQPPLLKILSAFTATATAEYFCDRGMNVLLIMDSLTRLAMAQREVGLSAGEPTAAKGYTPSVFSMMPKLLKRAGNFSGKGSITAVYTILVDNTADPVAEYAHQTLDGHIALTRDLARKNHFPAVDVLASFSQAMKDLVNDEHHKAAELLREWLAIYREAEATINSGLYEKGANKKIDDVQTRIDHIYAFLKQSLHDKIPIEDTLKQMKAIGE
ncbi:MAG: FliI/YscN family ATPase [Acidobacteria bacterium]|jgi:flagellum-specific ATP synthase|nr:FliI/YscN family ATPase [Acidobacteriota bacterium]